MCKMAYFFLFKSVLLANGENSGNRNGVCRYVRARGRIKILSSCIDNPNFISAKASELHKTALRKDMALAMFG